MADSLTISEAKAIIEDRFEVEDLRKVLKALHLPIQGHKPELQKRVIGLLDDIHYEPHNISKAKHKITEVYNQRLDSDLLAPKATDLIRTAGLKSRKKKKSSRYESDDEFIASDNSEDTDSTAVEEERRQMSVDGESITSKRSKTKTKRRKRIKELTSDEDSDNSEKESESKNSESDSDDKSLGSLEEYCGTTRTRRKKRSKQMKLFKEVQKEKKKKKTYVSSPSEDNNSDDDMSLTEKCKRKVARDKAKISTRKNNKKKRTIIITSDDDDQDDNNDDNNNNNKTNRRKVIDSEDSEENQAPRININEKNSIDEDDDEIEFVGCVPAELSTIIRSNYRVKVTSEQSSNTESEVESNDIIDSIDLNEPVNEDVNQEELVDYLSCISELSPRREHELLNPVTINANQSVTKDIESRPATPRASLSTPFQSNTNDISHDVNEDSMDISDILSEGEILSGDEVVDSYDLPATPNISVDLSRSGQNKDCDERPIDSVHKDRDNDISSDHIDRPSKEKSSEPKETNQSQVVAESEPETEPQPCPESEIIAEPDSPPLPPPPSQPEAPQPQLPTPSTIPLLTKTPTSFGLLPQREIVVKNGQAITVEPPPPLPPLMYFPVQLASVTIEQIQQRLNNNSDEIEAIDQTLKVSLICPISGSRVAKPCRSKHCNHFDCFSLDSFLEIRYKKKSEDWKCPKCNQPACKEYLFIDSLIDHIINHPAIDSSVESVTFDNRAIWRPDSKTAEKVASKSDKNAISIDDTAEEIIEINDDDDDDDGNGPPPAVSAAQQQPTNRTNLVIPKSQPNTSNANNGAGPSGRINGAGGALTNSSVNSNDPRLRLRNTGPNLSLISNPSGPPNVTINNQNRPQQSVQAPAQPNRSNNAGSFIPITSSGPIRSAHAPNQAIVNYSRLPSQVVKALGANNTNDASFEFASDGIMRGIYCNRCKMTLNIQNLTQIWSHFNDHLKNKQSNPTNQTNGHQNVTQGNVNQSRSAASSSTVSQNVPVVGGVAPVRSAYNANNNFSHYRNNNSFVNGYRQAYPNNQYYVGQPQQISNNVYYQNFSQVPPPGHPQSALYTQPPMGHQMPYQAPPNQPNPYYYNNFNNFN